jgi:hypothetical protein
MKKLAITAFVVGTLAMGFSAQPARADVSVQVTIGRFYDELRPYGRWVPCRYGRCWVPRRVARRWQPYTLGRWVYTDYGWTWVSRDPWGGSTCHYGSWVYLRGYGWSWVPGTVWAPAWVTWRYSDRYVGWAPLPPSVVFSSSGYSGRPVVLSQTQYVFVPTNRFVDTEVDSAWLPAQQSATIYRQTTPLTRFAVSDGIVRNTGIPLASIQGAAGGRIETRSISTANTAPQPMTAGGGGKGRQVAVVAPARDVSAAVAARPQENARPAPVKAEKGGKAPAGRESTSAGPAPRQESVAPRAAVKPERGQPRSPRGEARQEAAPPPAAAMPQRREPKAPKAEARQQSAPAPAAAMPQRREPKAPKPETRQQSAPAPAAAMPQREKAPKAEKATKGQQAPPQQPQGQPQPEAARPAPGPPPQAAPPNAGPAQGKPAKPEKEKKEKDKKD